MDNFIQIDGVQIELTPEQIEQLRKMRDKKEEVKSPFERADKDVDYYFVDRRFDVSQFTEEHDSIDDIYYKLGNYCTDEAIMKQHALHMKLNNLLWRFSMMHGGDKISWASDDDDIKGFFIAVNIDTTEFLVWSNIFQCDIGKIYFRDKETAEAAIEEVVKPFIKENPDFDWRKM